MAMLHGESRPKVCDPLLNRLYKYKFLYNKYHFCGRGKAALSQEIVAKKTEKSCPLSLIPCYNRGMNIYRITKWSSTCEVYDVPAESEEQAYELWEEDADKYYSFYNADDESKTEIENIGEVVD